MIGSSLFVPIAKKVLFEMPDSFPEITITQAINAFLDSLLLARSPNTARTYRNGMKRFTETLRQKKINPEEESLQNLKEDAIAWFTSDLKNMAPATEQLYLNAATQFYEFLSAENLLPVNLTRIHRLIKQRARVPGQRLPQFPREAIENVLTYAEKLNTLPHENLHGSLRNQRDRAFLLTLADTGLRVHEACRLRRGDFDWNEGKALIIGKGNRQAVIRFSKRAQRAIQQYLSARATIDGASGRPLSSLPIFARHDKGVGNKIKPITTTSGRNIVAQRVQEALGAEAVGTITPHSFRHFFVTTVLQATGNLKMAQELARHRNISVTTRYAHLSDDELDKGYHEIFENR